MNFPKTPLIYGAMTELQIFKYFNKENLEQLQHATKLKITTSTTINQYYIK
jgi:hypothetical protein